MKYNNKNTDIHLSSVYKRRWFPGRATKANPIDLFFKWVFVYFIAVIVGIVIGTVTGIAIKVILSTFYTNPLTMTAIIIGIMIVFGGAAWATRKELMEIDDEQG